MAKSKRTVKVSALAADAAAHAEVQRNAWATFSGIFKDVTAARDSLVTMAVYEAYTAVYRVNAWLSVDGLKSANDMFRSLLGLPADTPPSDPRIVAEKNFSDYVRLRSPIALEKAGKAKRKQGKRKPDTTADLLAYVKECVASMKPGSKRANPADVAAIYAEIRKWAELFAQSADQDQSKAA